MYGSSETVLHTHDDTLNQPEERRRIRFAIPEATLATIIGSVLCMELAWLAAPADALAICLGAADLGAVALTLRNRRRRIVTPEGDDEG